MENENNIQQPIKDESLKQDTNIPNNIPPQNIMNTQEKNHSSIGPIIASIIIIILIIIGGLYFWGAILNDRGYTPEQEMPQEDETTQKLTEQGTSDETLDIETDLKNTDIDNLDADAMNEIENNF